MDATDRPSANPYRPAHPELVTKEFPPGKLVFNSDEVTALLGYPNGKSIPPKILVTLKELHERALELVHPIYQYTIVPVESINHDEQVVVLAGGRKFHGEGIAEALRYSTHAAVFLSTLGHPIVEEIERLNMVDVSRGFFLDVLASVAMENLAEQVHLEIARSVFQSGSYVGHRYSPGYCDWDLTQQRVLFSLLENTLLSVQLTDHCMMVPRKSVSAIVGIGRKREEMAISPCGNCKRTDCMARRDEYINTLYQSEGTNEPL